MQRVGVASALVVIGLVAWAIADGGGGLAQAVVEVKHLRSAFR